MTIKRKIFSKNSLLTQNNIEECTNLILNENTSQSAMKDSINLNNSSDHNCIKNIDVISLFSEIFNDNQESAEIFKKTIMEEDVKISNELLKFIIRTKETLFCFFYLTDNIGIMNNEEEAVEKVDILLRKYLKNIENIDILHRREILKYIAETFSEKFIEFEFISPENSKQVNPSYHVIKGNSGLYIKKGISFLILRKKNRNVFRYAEVIAE